MPKINQLLRKGRKDKVSKVTAPALRHGYNSRNKKLTNNRAPPLINTTLCSCKLCPIPGM